MGPMGLFDEECEEGEREEMERFNCFVVNCLTDDDLFFELFVQYTCLEM